MPTTAQASQFARRGRSAARDSGAPARIANGNRISPAIRYRTPASSSGGIVSTPTRMARYVLPQTT